MKEKQLGSLQRMNARGDLEELEAASDSAEEDDLAAGNNLGRNTHEEVYDEDEEEDEDERYGGAGAFDDEYGEDEEMADDDDFGTEGRPLSA